MSRRRLEAEAIRDAILAVSGELDRTMTGTLMNEKNHGYVNSTVRSAGTAYAVNRRSVYLPVIRSGLYDVFQAFDFADPSASNGKRIPTTVAPQALFMMNDQVVSKCSATMAAGAARSSRGSTTQAGSVRHTWRPIAGRPPKEK